MKVSLFLFKKIKMKIEITKHHKAFFIIPTLWVSYDDETIISITWFAYSIDFVI